jgi:hypothetical protein
MVCSPALPYFLLFQVMFGKPLLVFTKFQLSIVDGGAFFNL